ncbi:hypothetical protein [Paenibacillus alkalitolerans]|uniref:hypothetical protein n=1 Tax=Paenibacillus alkalitolerans TaxID=2799335 RepID=UPI0018F7CFB7|nr:hypothetical protein [Paenibacillus alkalitolerans]
MIKEGKVVVELKDLLASLGIDYAKWQLISHPPETNTDQVHITNTLNVISEKTPSA